MKTFKTTQKDFELFKSECHFWIEKFGLTDWDIKIILQDIGEEYTYAQVHITYMNRLATICLNAKIDEKLTVISIKNTALHEVLHIVHGKCLQLMTARFVSEDEVREADHELVVRLTNVFSSVRDLI